MKKILIWVMSSVAFCWIAGAAEVSKTSGAIVIDGKLDEPAWQQTVKHSDFAPLRKESRKKAEVKTEFMLACDADNFYIGIDCQEPRMNDIDKDAVIWTGDGVEVFISPSGKPDEYYQFRVNAAGPVFQMFYGEAGAIRPDPYHPEWEHKVNLRHDGWSIEMRLPLHAFYMTNSSAWSNQWLFNVARSRRLARQSMSWSPLNEKFNETTRFRVISGLPSKAESDDLYVKTVAAKIDHFSDNLYHGRLMIEIWGTDASKGTYDLVINVPHPQKEHRQKITLKEGANNIMVDKTVFAALGRSDIGCRLLKNGKTVAFRTYPANIVFAPMEIKLTNPAYRNNFYPGQKSDYIEGIIDFQLSDKQLKNGILELSFSGKNLETVKKSYPINGKALVFSLETLDLPDGTYELEARAVLREARPISQKIVIRRLAPRANGKDMAFIENQHVILNGKKIFPRFLSATYWRGGEAFRKKFDADNLYIDGQDTKLSIVLEPERLIKGIEAREATRDVKPCKELFDKIASVVERNRNNNFIFYKLFDEPECRNISPVYAKYLYDFLKEIDPYHPIQISSRAPALYLNCADLFGMHPYIAPTFDGKGGRFLNIPVHKVRDYFDEIGKLDRKDKAIAFVQQFFSYKANSGYADYPTFDEIEAQFWSGIIHKVRMLRGYAYHDLGDRPQLYEGFRYVAGSSKALEEIILGGEYLDLQIDEPENMLDAALLKNNGKYLLLAVNLKNAPLKAELKSDELNKVATWDRFRGESSIKIPDGNLKLFLKPYEAVLLTSEPMDKGLPSRSEVVKLIEKLEQERRASKSILFEKGLQIEIDCSAPGRSSLNMQNKLFDGTTDVLAWQHVGAEREPFVELSFPKFTPKFSKIRLYGTPLSKDIKITMKKRGNIIELIPRKVKQREYMIEFDYGEELSTIKIRFEFPRPGKKAILELYEIEMLP